MAAKETVTILGIAATADEWTAWSAVGTVAAAVIAVTALLLPLLGAWRRRHAANTDALNLNNAILVYVVSAIRIMKIASQEYNAYEKYSLSACAAAGCHKGQILRALAKKP